MTFDLRDDGVLVVTLDTHRWKVALPDNPSWYYVYEWASGYTVRPERTSASWSLRFSSLENLITYLKTHRQGDILT